MNRDVCEHFNPVDLPCDKCNSVQKSTQPEALRLADALDAYCTPQDVSEQAAAELRRLHAQRDALLKALKNIDKEFRKYGRQHWPESVKARAAIAKCEEKA